MTSFDLDFAHQDHFALLGLPRRYALDRGELDRLFLEVQGRVHPDKHAHLSDADRRLAMQWSTQVNDAYQTLTDPQRRARYLLQLAGHDPRIETNTVMPTEFLLEQMDLRETVAEARESGDIDRLDALHRRLRQEILAQQEVLRQTLDESQDHARAGEVVRQMMFQEKLLTEIDEALAAIEG